MKLMGGAAEEGSVQRSARRGGEPITKEQQACKAILPARRAKRAFST